MLLRHLIQASAAAAYAVTGSVRPTESLPNVSTLDARCTVSLSDASHAYTAPIRVDGEFHFHDVDAGSYLLSTHCPSHSFLPLRVDVGQSQSTASRSQLDATAAADGQEAADDAQPDDVVVYRTTRGGEWNAVLGREPYPINLLAVGAREYYASAQSFSVYKLLKNPMVLLGIFGAFTVFVMPQIVQWIDPEGAEEMHRIRAEKAKEAANARPKDNPVEKLQNFDVSGWLAGKQK